jgi:hypothetical protein
LLWPDTWQSEGSNGVGLQQPISNQQAVQPVQPVQQQQLQSVAVVGEFHLFACRLSTAPTEWLL